MFRATFRVYASALALLIVALLSPSGTANAQAASSATAFAPETIGHISAAQTITVPVHSAGIAAGVSLSSAGAHEFQILSGGTCAAGQTYRAGDTCTVAITFAPTAPGLVSTALHLRGSGGHLLGAAKLRGVGLGSAAAFTPGLVTTLPMPSQSAQTYSAIASAGGSKAYLADTSTTQLLLLDAAAGNSSVLAALPASGPVTSIASDVDGAVFLLQASGAVFRIDPDTFAVTPIDLSGIPAGSTAGPTALTVDHEGRLLLAFGPRVFRLQGSTWTALTAADPCADTTAACGDGGDAAHASFNVIHVMAVDAAGDLLLADESEHRIRRIDAISGLVRTVAGTGQPCMHGRCGDNGPASAAALGTITGITVDPLGNIYLAELGRGLRRIDATTGNIAPVLPGVETRFRSGDVQLAALRDGSVLLLAQAEPSTVARFVATSATLNFARTPVGQTSSDSVQTVTLSNLGNMPLTLATPTAGTNPSTTADFPLSSTQTCPQLSTSSASQTLAPGDSCTLQVKFAPTLAGNISGRVVLTESLAAAQTPHTVAVQGIAAAPAQASVALDSDATSPLYGQPVTLRATVQDATNPAATPPTGTVTFSEASNVLGDVSLTNGVARQTITLPSTGPHTYAVSYSGDSNYAPSAQNTTTSVTVGRAGSVFTIAVPNYPVGYYIRLAFSLSGQYAGTGIALPSGLVNFTVFDSSSNVISAGTCDYDFRVGSVDEATNIGLLHAGSYTLRLSYPGDGNFLPRQQDYTLAIRQAQQTITFASIASPVTYGTPPIALSATAFSGAPPAPTGLPVTFSVLSGPGSIVSGQLVVTGVGNIIVAADQAGNSDYAAASRATQAIVAVRPVARLTWATPAPIATGTPLSGTQLNASATGSNGQPLAGTYTYSPPAGTVLPIGNTTLNVTFIPSDTSHYGNVTLTASVVLTVHDLVTPVIRFPGGTVAYGSTLAPALNATATNNGTAIPGAFVYTTGATTLGASTYLPVGTYTVTASFTPSDSTNDRGGSATAAVTVKKGAASVVLTSPASPVLLGSSITFTAKVSGGSAVPTGTVQFTAGSTMLGSAPLDGSGLASFTLNTLPAGSETINAVYSGDANYSGASATLTEVVADFTLALAPNSAATQAVLPGKAATYQFTVAPTVTSALVSNITFTLAGLPSGATYTVTPATVASGSAATGVTLAITAPATLTRRDSRSPWQGRSAALAAALLLLPFTSRLRRGSTRMRRAGVLAAILFCCALLLSASGCGTGVGYFDQSGTTYPLTLSANSGSLSHTAAVTLEVQ